MTQFNKISEHFPIVLLSILTIKSVIFGTTLPEMGCVLGIASIVAISTYMQRTKKLEEHAIVLSKQNEVIQTMALELSKVKNAMEGIKLTNGFTKK